MLDMVGLTRKDAIYLVSLMGYQNVGKSNYSPCELRSRLIELFNLDEDEICETYPKFGVILRALEINTESVGDVSTSLVKVGEVEYTFNEGS